jgi:5-methyltetrahydrofolate--homocysteine methyltransferase
MKELKELVKEGKASEIARKVKQFLENDIEADKILNEGLIKGIDQAGELFQSGEFYIPELLMSARAMKEGMNLLKPLLIKEGAPTKGKIVLGTVKGDRHDIGKTLVSMILEGAGFEIIDLGVDVPAESFIKSIKEHSPVAIGLSALLTLTMLEMKKVIKKIKKAGLRENVIIMIGGAPVNEDFAREVGADFYGDNPILAKNYLLSRYK